MTRSEEQSDVRPAPRRWLEAWLPDDAWSAEFLDELDAEAEERRGGSVTAWYLRRLLTPATMAFVWRVRARASRADSRGPSAGSGAWDALSIDLRHAFRLIRREPRTTIFIALTLALGIGSVSSMVEVADRLFLRGPLGVPAHEELSRLYLAFDDEGGARTSPWVPYATAAAMRDASSISARLTLYRFEDRLARIGDRVGPVRVSVVDEGYFGVLGARPIAGTFFDVETLRGSDAVAVLSSSMATSAFADPARAVGQSIELGGVRRTVVGVTEAGFAGPHLERVDLWLPLDETAAPSRNWWVVARTPEVPTTPGARTGLEAQAQSVHDRTDPGRFFQWAREGRVRAAPIGADDSGGPSAEASIARLLLAVVGLVLVIAGANAANLLLARIARRQSEVSVRLALGSGRGRLLRLLVTESTLLALVGALFSVPIAYLGGALLRRVLLPQVAWTESPVDLGFLLGVGALATLVGMAIGLLPARVAHGVQLAGALSGIRSPSRKRSRTQLGLATTQVALSALLLLGAGLFLKSFWTIRVTDLGTEASEVLVVNLRSLDPGALADGRANEVEGYRRALELIRDLDGMNRSALTVGVPFVSSFGTTVHVEGLDSIPELPGGGPFVSLVSGRYFDAMGTAVLRGSPISEVHVAQQERVVVVNQAMVDLVWPDRDPIGACVRIQRSDNECSTVIGVAADVHRTGYREARSFQLYVPMGSDFGFSGTTLVTRPSIPAAVATERIQQSLAGVVPGADFVEVLRLDSWLDAEIRPWRMGAAVMTMTAALAALVSILGVYGVLSYLVVQRRREIGVRMALGASAPSVRRLVVRTGVVTGVLGVAVATLALFATTPWIRPLLFETAVMDPSVWFIVASGVLLASIGACILPAVHATRIQPVECLRHEA